MKNSTAGFTLVETLASIGILGIITGGVLMAIGSTAGSQRGQLNSVQARSSLSRVVDGVQGQAQGLALAQAITGPNSLTLQFVDPSAETVCGSLPTAARTLKLQFDPASKALLINGELAAFQVAGFVGRVGDSRVTYALQAVEGQTVSGGLELKRQYAMPCEAPVQVYVAPAQVDTLTYTPTTTATPEPSERPERSENVYYSNSRGEMIAGHEWNALPESERYVREGAQGSDQPKSWAQVKEEADKAHKPLPERGWCNGNCAGSAPITTYGN